MNTIITGDTAIIGPTDASSPSTTRIDYPSWKSIIDSTIRLFEIATNQDAASMRKVCDEHIILIDKIRKVIQEKISEFHPILAYEISSQTACRTANSASIEETMAILNKLKLNSNEFYSVFDASLKDQIIVDERIREILGIEPEQFRMKALLGFDPDNPLFHPDDLFHSIRFGTIAYMVLSIPHLEFKPYVDFYRARFRVGTKASKITEIKNLEYVMLEKRAYMIEDRKVGSPIAMQILYRWSVYAEDDFDGIKTYFVSDPLRSTYLHELWYLFHAYLLGISPKFILMLDARRNYDRNKAIALYMNEQIEKHTGIKSGLDEGQVADCFAKTIRPKIAEAITIWEKREKDLVISSDQEAVSYAKRLGLLPIPKRVLEMMYSNVMEA